MDVRIAEPEDGEYDGVLQLRPSREAALRTRRIDRFLDQTIELPVRVRFETVRGEWGEVVGVRSGDGERHNRE